MKSISLKLQEDILKDAEYLLKFLEKSRNKYINEAIEFYNQHHKRKLLAEQLKRESKLISKDSMIVLKEFEKLENDF